MEMMKLALMSTFLFFLLFSTASHAYLAPRTLLYSFSKSSTNSNRSLTTKELWFNQTLDHYSPFVSFSPPLLFSFNFDVFLEIKIWVSCLEFKAFFSLKMGYFKVCFLNKSLKFTEENWVVVIFIKCIC
jgi:hypothetical protein